MNLLKKTEEQLQKDLNSLQEKYNSLFELYQKKTEEQKNVDELLNIKERALSVSFDAIVIADLFGNIKYTNEAFTLLWGYSSSEIFGLNMKSLGESADELEYIKNEIILKGKIRGETVAKKKDGSLFYVKYSAYLVTNTYGKPVAMLSSNKDITERKVYEQQLIMAKEKAQESDMLKSEFLNNISHEIRTPIHGILGFSNILTNKDLPEANRLRGIEIIKNNSYRLLQIIEDILEIAKLGSKQVKVEYKYISINELFKKLSIDYELKSRKQNTEFICKTELSDQESTLYTDIGILERTLRNILKNAVMYTKKGFIEIGYKIKYINEIGVFEIYIKDTGIGIHPEKHETVFKKFSQEDRELGKQYGGLGLGLSIAKENIELLGGKISLESEKGKGSTFYISIPYYK